MALLAGALRPSQWHKHCITLVQARLGSLLPCLNGTPVNMTMRRGAIQQ